MDLVIDQVFKAATQGGSWLVYDLYVCARKKVRAFQTDDDVYENGLLLGWVHPFGGVKASCVNPSTSPWPKLWLHKTGRSLKQTPGTLAAKID